MKLLASQRILGVMVASAGVIPLPALLLSIAFGDRIAHVFATTTLAAALCGFAAWFPARRHHEEVRRRDGFLITTLAWITVSSICALPFMLGPPHLDLGNAFFESASGLTTTGNTVLFGLDDLPKSLLFYRQCLNFFGGIGIVILALAILPMLRIGGAQLFRAEVSGPVKDAKLTPRVKETANALWLVYFGLNLLCILAFWFGGMDLLEATGYAFATVATGGFAMHDANFGHFASPLLEAICCCFMLLGGINFSLHFIAWQRASLANYFQDAELRIYFTLAATITAIVAFALYGTQASSTLAESFRSAAFHAISNLTTTGFHGPLSNGWPVFVGMLLLLAGFVGACSGSTSGGMKVLRIILLFKQGAREMHQLLHPKARFVVKMGNQTLAGAALAAITGFCTLYISSFVVLSLLLAASGVEWTAAWSAIASCLNNASTGLGMFGMRFGELNDFSLWICSFTMILGRLEIFTLLVLFTPAFWRDYR